MDESVLIVDDDRSFLEPLLFYLAEEMPEVVVRGADNGDEAVKIIESNNIDLLVTDLKMPKMDGFVLLSYMQEQHPATPVIVLTGHEEPGLGEQIGHLGAERLMEKPVDLMKLRETMGSALAKGISGSLQGLSVPTFIQALEMDQATGTLTIRSPRGEGQLYFREGRLINAKQNGSSGLEAALFIISLENAKMEMSGENPVFEDKVGMSLKHLILEAGRRKDESDRKR